VSAVFPSEREVSPMVTAFVDFLEGRIHAGNSWQNDPSFAP
jgi:hypothetical protein